MVFDKLENCASYFGMHKNIEKGFNFIKEAIANNLPQGKYEIDGKEVYGSVQEYETCPNYEEKKFEGHENYIDIQFIVKGEEYMQVSHISDMTSKTPYNDEKDVEFYHDSYSFADACVKENGYAIFFPQDIHKPGLAPDKISGSVKKVLVKIKV